MTKEEFEKKFNDRIKNINIFLLCDIPYILDELKVEYVELIDETVHAERCCIKLDEEFFFVYYHRNLRENISLYEIKDRDFICTVSFSSPVDMNRIIKSCEENFLKAKDKLYMVKTFGEK